MAVGLLIKYSKEMKDIYIPVAGEKSFIKDLVPLVITNNKLIWLKNLPTGLLINCENIKEVIFELQILRKDLNQKEEWSDMILKFILKDLIMLLKN